MVICTSAQVRVEVAVPCVSWRTSTSVIGGTHARASERRDDPAGAGGGCGGNLAYRPRRGRDREYPYAAERPAGAAAQAAERAAARRALCRRRGGRRGGRAGGPAGGARSGAGIAAPICVS